MPKNLTAAAVRGGGAAALVVALVLAAPHSATAATSVEIDFTTGYTLDASPIGQNGWSGSAGYDVELVSNADYPDSGLDAAGASLRISNSLFPGGAINHATTPALDAAEAVGESTVADDNTFTASYTVAPAAGYVEGINIEVGIGRSSRAGGTLGFRHVGGELELYTIWVPSDAPDVSLGSWRSAVLGTFDAAVPHEIVTITHMLDDANDVTEVYVDGNPIAYTPTWEYYHRIVNEDPSSAETVLALNFKGSRSAPSADGVGYLSGLDPVVSEGLLFTDISYATSNDPGWTPTTVVPPVSPIPAADDSELVDRQFADEDFAGDATGGTVELGPQAAGQLYAVYHYSAPTFVGWFTAGPTGTLTFTLPSGLTPGAHKVAVYDSTGALAGWGSVTVPPASGGGGAGGDVLPPTGDDVPFAAIGAGAAALVLGSVLVAASIRRRRTPRHAV